MTTDNALVIDNRDATRADAQTLGNVYRVLTTSVKKHKLSLKAVADAWADETISLHDVRFDRDEATLALDVAMDDAWSVLRTLPNGTVAPGGATPQTVGLEFFNKNLNRGLKARITASQARQINKLSF